MSDRTDPGGGGFRDFRKDNFGTFALVTLHKKARTGLIATAKHGTQLLGPGANEDSDPFRNDGLIGAHAEMDLRPAEDGNHRHDAVLIVRYDEAPEPSKELLIRDVAVEVRDGAHELVEEGERVDNGCFIVRFESLPDGEGDGLAAGDVGMRVGQGVILLQDDVRQLLSVALGRSLGHAGLGDLVNHDDDAPEKRVLRHAGGVGGAHGRGVRGVEGGRRGRPAGEGGGARKIGASRRHCGRALRGRPGVRASGGWRMEEGWKCFCFRFGMMMWLLVWFFIWWHCWMGLGKKSGNFDEI